MIQPYDLLTALDPYSLMLFFWFTLLFDLPRYVMSAVAMACVPWQSPPPKRYRTSAIVAGHNEAKTIRQCVRSLEVDEIIVVDDGSTDDMWLEVQRLKEEGVIANAIHLHSRQSKPAAVNAGLALCSGEIVLIIDADTVLAPGAVAAVLGYFSDPKVGGVNFNLEVGNERATLTTRFQAIEYFIAVSAGKRMADALGILPNVSGAAGAFRRTALEQVGGQDIEVAEDAALAMKLRDAGWQLRFAPDAIARTTAPETMVSLLLQRLRWDSSIITIWWRKHARNLNPFGRDFRPANVLTSLDVLWFSAVLPLVLPVYVLWLYNSVGEVSIAFLLTVFLGLCALDIILCVITCVPLRFWPYLPYYVVVQNLVMKPMRMVALVLELTLQISRRDNYIPAHQRWKLS
jgi:cellulose synthase/poly-beta-1,6-N-acetylglucosamine synthase-like glycosyltransferase